MSTVAPQVFQPSHLSRVWSLRAAGLMTVAVAPATRQHSWPSKSKLRLPAVVQTNVTPWTSLALHQTWRWRSLWPWLEPPWPPCGEAFCNKITNTIHPSSLLLLIWLMLQRKNSKSCPQTASNYSNYYGNWRMVCFIETLSLIFHYAVLWFVYLNVIIPLTLLCIITQICQWQNK